MEREDSLPHLPVPTNCPNPEAYQLGSCPPVSLPENSFYYYPHIYVWVWQEDLTLRFPQQNSVYTSHLPHSAT